VRAAGSGFEHHFAVPREKLAHDGAQQGGLADAVASKKTADLAGFDAERDAAQRLGRAVKHIDLVDRERRHRPRYTSMTRSLALT
jgi:hypothetical protein